jgi:hypothetical protein
MKTATDLTAPSTRLLLVWVTGAGIAIGRTSR